MDGGFPSYGALLPIMHLVSLAFVRILPARACAYLALPATGDVSGPWSALIRGSPRLRLTFCFVIKECQRHSSNSVLSTTTETTNQGKNPLKQQKRAKNKTGIKMNKIKIKLRIKVERDERTT